MKFLLDLFPIVFFFGAFKWGQGDPEAAASLMHSLTGLAITVEHAPILIATITAILCTFIQIGIVYARGEKPDVMLWISLAVIVIFGSLTIYLQNEWFIKWKPSILYWIFGGILLFGACTGHNFIRVLLGKQITLPETHWGKLQWIWIIFFAIMGGINLLVAYTMSTEVWVNFKLFGLMALTFIFTIGVGVWITKVSESLTK